MKNFLALLFLGLSFFCEAQVKTALFLGNSYTYVNNLPQLVSDIASSKGDSLSFDNSTPGGYTLQGHATNATSINKINSSKWDFVILQEQSQRPSFPPSQVQTDVFPYAKYLDSLIERNDSCTNTLFYMTWGRKYGDLQNCASYPPLCTYQGMQKRLRDSYVQMANDNNASVAPVGMAWKNSIAADSNLNLYSSDNSHPSIFGSYLAACVFYSSMFHESSIGGSHPSSVPSGTAFFLQNIADMTVFDSLTTWRIDTNSAINAEFTHEIQMDGQTVKFYDSSNVIGGSYFWDFGDGNTSSMQNPTHTYAKTGIYKISLQVKRDCDIDLAFDSVEIFINSIENIDRSDFKIYPNPSNGFVTIRLESEVENLSIELLDISGSVGKRWNATHVREFEFSYPEKGLFILKIVADNKQGHFKIFLE